MKGKVLSLSLLALMAVFTLSSCKKDKEDKFVAAEVKVQEDVDASNGAVYYNLTTGQEVAKTADWDISFSEFSGRGMFLVGVNSGDGNTGKAEGALINVAFDALNEIPGTAEFKTGHSTGYDVWGIYTGMTAPMHAILPKTDYTFVFKTNSGKYAKVQLLSVYKGNPDITSEVFASPATRPLLGVATFRYAVQQNGSKRFN